MFCKMITTTNVRFKKETKQSFRILSTTTTVEVQSTKIKIQKFPNFVFCNLYSTRKGLRVKYNAQLLPGNDSFLMVIPSGALLFVSFVVLRFYDSLFTLKMTETEILPKTLSPWRQCFIRI